MSRPTVRIRITNHSLSLCFFPKGQKKDKKKPKQERSVGDESGGEGLCFPR